ncbi:hypothetical protein LTR78_003330 [Recurvomyces mirabilis]|uniref:Rhodopsin domain-containing protein n=1 Tax=Recurvomyces mirabilis TaxID=574656 RepID=A0AAE0WT46_9PEZI|nr:hypothetical protein LTR78_003330 [Recurvomyces mirabilis]KAK5156852.1 hypothetical protein LTS14_004369 [Recurvomyces mirabilis]
MSKLSITLLLHRLTPNEQQRRVFAGGMIVSAVWTFASIFAVALQCDLSRPWITLDQTCASSARIWYAVGAFDIITEIMLVAMAAYLVWDLKMIWQSKATVVFGFAVRLLMIIAIGLRLAAFDPIGLTTNPFILEDEFIIWMQTELCFANVSASIPTLRVFVNSLTTSYGGSGEKRTRSSNKDYSYGSQGSRRQRTGIMLSSLKVGSRPKARASVIGSNLRSNNDELDTQWPAKSAGEAYDYTISGARRDNLGDRSQEASSKGGGGVDAISVGSSESQQRMIIKKDITWDVQSERN